MTLQIWAQPVALDIYLTRANDFAVPFQFLDPNDAPITTWGGYEFFATLRRYAGADDGIDFDIDDTDKATGLWVASLPADIAENLALVVPQAPYAWDLLRINDAGKRKTMFAGSCFVKPNVTEGP